MGKETDQIYVERVLAGEVNAFSILVQRHQDLVYSICLRVLGQKEDAEDTAQEAFIKAYRSLKSYRGQAAFSTWIYRIAYNTAVSRTRKKNMEWNSPGEDGLEGMPEEKTEGMPESVWKDRQDALVREVIATLPEKDQLLIELFYIRDLKISEISEITGLGESNVKVRLHRIRKDLSVLLKDRIYTTIEEEV